MKETLYTGTATPIQTDGRDIDSAVAALGGEAASQKAGPVEEHLARMASTWETLPVPQADDPSYYDRPMLKEPVWKPYIPLYYFVGGATGASLALGAAAQLDTSGKLNRLVRQCYVIGIAGSALSSVLLIADLGRSKRFVYMLRVFRPTSPMNMGAWILAFTPGAALTASLLSRRKSGLVHWMGEAAGYASGVFGAALATYTGVLVGNTAIPVWQESRRILPILFGASAAASSGSLFAMMTEEPRAARIAQFFGTAGRAAELAASYAMERRAGAVPRVAKPLKSGLSGFLWKSAAALSSASLVAALAPGQSRKKRIAAGALGGAGSLLLRFAVEQAGAASARGPRAAFHQQRAGHGAREVEPSNVKTAMR